jgi:hypothetical protein
MISYNDKLINQLKRISKNAESEKEFTKQTLNKWEKLTAKAFEEIGIETFKYLNTNTPEARQEALTRAANTLSKKLEAHDKKLYKETVKTQNELIKKSKENLIETNVNQRTLNQMQHQGLLPEKSDLMNMSLKELKQAEKMMQVAPELRALVAVQDYSMEYFNRYFKNLLDENQPGVRERVDKIIYAFGMDYVALKDFMERTQSPSFKGGYGDTNDYIESNSDESYNTVMFDRLERMELELGIGA